MVSRCALALIVLALGSCRHGADTRRAADAAAPPKVTFETHPAEQIAGVKDPHAYRGKALCQRCHRSDLKLTNDPIALCRECHSFRHGNHPVGVVQKTAVKDLPLEGAKVACHTCHDPHQRTRVLRKPFNDLCTECHKR